MQSETLKLVFETYTTVTRGSAVLRANMLVETSAGCIAGVERGSSLVSSYLYSRPRFLATVFSADAFCTYPCVRTPPHGCDASRTSSRLWSGQRSLLWPLLKSGTFLEILSRVRIENYRSSAVRIKLYYIIRYYGSKWTISFAWYCPFTERYVYREIYKL